MEFVPVDAGAEGGLDRWYVAVIGAMGGVGLCLLVVFPEDAGGFWFGAVHVAVPFAGAAHVCLGKPAVVDEHAFERGVEAAFEPVAVTRHRAGIVSSGSRKQKSVPSLKRRSSLK